MSESVVDRVHIDRFRATYHVARDHPDAAGVRRRLDDVMTGPLSRALRGTLAQPLPLEEGVWVIDRIGLELRMDVDCAPELVARHWARHFALSLVRAAHAGDGVLYFPDRARFLAAFLVDLVDGMAWRHWYWRPFDGLKVLPLAAAIRTAVLDGPDRGLAALLAIEQGPRRRVLAALTEGEAKRILAGLSSAHDVAGPPDRAVDRALANEGAWAADRPAIAALALYLALVAVDRALGGRDVAALAGALATLATLRIGLAAPSLDRLAEALRQGDVASLPRSAGLPSPRVLQPVLTLPPSARDRVASWLVDAGTKPFTRPPTPEITESDGVATWLQTRFGGALILLPLLDRLPLAETTVEWPAPDGLSAAALVRLLVLAKCVGAADAFACVLDPLIRELLGLPATLLPRAVGDWTRTIPPREWRSLQRAVDRAGPRPKAAPAFSWRRTTRGGVGVVLIGHDHWLFCAPSGPRPSRRWFMGAAISDPPPAEDAIRAKVERDLAWLTLPPFLCRARAADTALSLAARRLLSRVAARLFGFAGSSAPYLWRNFLDVPGRLLDDGEERRVVLGRPPLHVVLNQSGLARARFTLSWLDERPFVLGTED